MNVVTNIIQNWGVLPIDLGPAKLQRTTQTLLHYYDLTAVQQEFKELNEQHDRLQLIQAKNIQKINDELDNYNKAAGHIRQGIQTKLDNMLFHTKGPRVRRGLYNFFGTTIKHITGNLDHNDGERINLILHHLETNQINLKKQGALQYSLNQQIMDHFNTTIQKIEHNEETLTNRINQLTDNLNIANKESHILFINMGKPDIKDDDINSTKDIYNQLIILYNILYSLLQDIENSLSFCKIKTVHPSIIKPQQLYSELQRISPYYKEELPFELKPENVPDFEKILDVNCHIENTKIIYLLSIPINFKMNFQLYHLHSIPSFIGPNIVTLITNNKYILKSGDTIKPLKEKCLMKKHYQRPTHFLNNNEVNCEKQIFGNEGIENCKYIKIELPSNKIELITETNQYLVVFPLKNQLNFECKEKTEIETLQGIYLIEKEPCKVFYKNELLPFGKEAIGKPLILKELNFPTMKLPSTKIRLENLDLTN